MNDNSIQSKARGAFLDPTTIDDSSLDEREGKAYFYCGDRTSSVRDNCRIRRDYFRKVQRDDTTQRYDRRGPRLTCACVRGADSIMDFI